MTLSQGPKEQFVRPSANLLFESVARCDLLDKRPMFPTKQTAGTDQAFKRCLPIRLTSLVGREPELAKIYTFLRRSQVRLLTLVGTGGVGKTHLALAAANALLDVFTEGICFVPLAPLSDFKQVLPTIAQILGLREAGDRLLLKQLQVHLADRHLLLLLDNFEHVVAAAPYLTDLLLSCPRLHLLVTSRESLHLSGEYEFPVLPLAVPDLTQLPELDILAQVAAVRLYVGRAQAIQHTFQLTSTSARTIAQICVQLDGLPLAIELAAARSKLLPPQALLDLLTRRLDVLTNGARDLPARQQTMRDTLRWSYDLLNAEEQRLFRWLSVCEGGCTLEAATAITQAAGLVGNEDGKSLPWVLAGVASLLDKSLLLQTEQEGEEPRFVMLKTIREFGLECLEAYGELKAARQAHVAYYLQLTEEAWRYLFGLEAASWLKRLEQEYENLRTALQWVLECEDEEPERESRTAIAVRLGSVLWRFWTMRGSMNEGRTFLEWVLTSSEKSRQPVRIKALIAAGMLAWYQEDYVWAESIGKELLRLSQRCGDQPGLAHAISLLAGAALRRGDHARARTLAEQSLAVFRAIGNTWMVATLPLFLTRWSSAQGEDATTQQQLEESLVLYRALGHPGDIAWPLIYQVRQALKLGDQTRAHVLLQEAIRLCRKVGNKWLLAHALGFLGQLTLEKGNLVSAYALLTESLRLNQEAGNRRSIAWSLFLLATVVMLQGDIGQARTLYEQGLAIATALEHRGLIAPCLQGLVVALTAQEQFLSAARLWSAAQTRHQSFIILPQVLRTSVERAQTTARTQLGDEVFAQALAEGRTMTPEQILAAQKSMVLSSALAAKQYSVSPAAPAGLTAREVEVLQLVAQGLTDKQVSERLVISPRTVNTHLTSIYKKIGVSSRTVAICFAVEHQLVQAGFLSMA